jgi:hypothetical protein
MSRWELLGFFNMAPRAVRGAAIGLAALAVGLGTLGCAGGKSGRDLAAGWRGLFAIRGTSVGGLAELPRAPYADAVFVGRVASGKLAEASGMVASRRRDDLLWALNDSGRKPRLFALGTDGSDRGFVLVEGADAIDWEALAAFEQDGRAYLVVADVGDNFSWRRSAELLVIEEPHVTGERLPHGAATRVAWRIPFRFEDGPRDCEAVAVDAAKQRALLLSKRTEPPVLYELALRPGGPGSEGGKGDGPPTLRVARRLGTAPGIPPPTRADVEEARWLGRYRSMPTGLDLSPDGALAAVVTYKDAYLFRRAPNESWAATFARAPARIPLPPMQQAEAIAFEANGRSLFVTSEKRPAPLFRLDWRGAGPDHAGAKERGGGRRARYGRPTATRTLPGRFP